MPVLLRQMGGEGEIWGFLVLSCSDLGNAEKKREKSAQWREPLVPSVRQVRERTCRPRCCRPSARLDRRSCREEEGKKRGTLVCGAVARSPRECRKEGRVKKPVLGAHGRRIGPRRALDEVGGKKGKKRGKKKMVCSMLAVLRYVKFIPAGASLRVSSCGIFGEA